MSLNLLRPLSVFLRKKSETKHFNQTEKLRQAWWSELAQFKKTSLQKNTLAIIRLDDIGDYLLFRNALEKIKRSDRFSNHHLTLIGNVVWKSVFEKYDAQTVDECLWVDKRAYFSDKAYRKNLWSEIQARGFETVLAPSRSRPVLLDDTLVKATQATETFASENCLANESLRQISDAIYTNRIEVNPTLHECFYNQEIIHRFCNISATYTRPFLPQNPNSELPIAEVLCFIGGSAGSKKWSEENWIQFINLMNTSGKQVSLLGGPGDKKMAEKIAQKSTVENLVGKYSLPESIEIIGQSGLIISGDTMAVHAAVSFDKPIVVLSNGVNSSRFVDYEKIGYTKIKVFYSAAFLQHLATHKKAEDFRWAVSSDLNSLSPQAVFDGLRSDFF